MMLPSKRSLEENPLLCSDYEDKRCDEEPNKPEKRAHRIVAIQYILLLFLIFCVASGVMLLVLGRDGTSTQARIACRNPSDRQEWRDLSKDQKQNYLDAVLCLKETPSRLNMNQSLYDDFPWVHALIGEYCA